MKKEMKIRAAKTERHYLRAKHTYGESSVMIEYANFVNRMIRRSGILFSPSELLMAYDACKPYIKIGYYDLLSLRQQRICKIRGKYVSRFQRDNYLRSQFARLDNLKISA